MSAIRKHNIPMCDIVFAFSSTADLDIHYNDVRAFIPKLSEKELLLKITNES